MRPQRNSGTTGGPWSACHAKWREGKSWFIYRIDDLAGSEVARVQSLTPEHRSAMDAACFSFDLTADKILRGYTPEQNEHI